MPFFTLLWLGILALGRETTEIQAMENTDLACRVQNACCFNRGRQDVCGILGAKCKQEVLLQPVFIRLRKRLCRVTWRVFVQKPLEGCERFTRKRNEKRGKILL
jgi:hypothetical protein